MFDELCRLLPDEILFLNESMQNHTTFKIGGPADLLICPRTIEEIKVILQYCANNPVPCFVLGMGSNLLVLDKGIRGIVIKFSDNFNACQVDGEEIRAQAGIRLSALAKTAARHSLTGLEFAEGIPGSLGGAVLMNAGAYGGEMKDIITEVEAIDRDGKIQIFTADELDFHYRHSIFQENDFTVLTARMQLHKGSQEEIYAKMQEHARSRREKQPLEHPSAGSTFKRPEGYYVGPMVEELNFKGFRIGGAEVSEKHAGFIINKGDATAADVLQLIQKIQYEAKNKFGVDLQPEIRIVGES